MASATVSGMAGKVLLVEDDMLVGKTVSSGLKAAGFEVTMAYNGLQAVKEFKLRRPDVIIMDVIMPDRGGIETIGDIRMIDATIPIIAVSGGGRTQNMEFLEIAKRCGATEILPKPFQLRALVALIRTVLTS
ncbi:response regulator transcription factor [Thalassospira marina]|uniref:Response regulator n=1 Tax=Thalassospira marina TaxID=2048283 RepID=A0A2N3KWM5_9PROT|nr:response regulator [Thalassospira marina]AUG53838.1 response regulator [Thalassospira marina]PKR54981.1 response regulator [Thalassospira marina]